MVKSHTISYFSSISRFHLSLIHPPPTLLGSCFEFKFIWTILYHKYKCNFLTHFMFLLCVMKVSRFEILKNTVWFKENPQKSFVPFYEFIRNYSIYHVGASAYKILEIESCTMYVRTIIYATPTYKKCRTYTVSNKEVSFVSELCIV